MRGNSCRLIVGHTNALDIAKVLHRDLSGDNILIDKDGNGFLTDWDLCRYTDSPLERRRKGRTVGLLRSTAGA